MISFELAAGLIQYEKVKTTTSLCFSVTVAL